MTENATIPACDICMEAKHILFSPCNTCLQGRECINCFLQVIQTSFKCPTCRGPLCADALREVNAIVDQVETHTQNTIHRSLRHKVTETIDRVRRMRSFRAGLNPASTVDQYHTELQHVASDLAWMRTMTSSHTNFANRFLPVRHMAHLTLQQPQSPLAVNELNMTPQEMVDAMFPFPPLEMEEVVIGVVDLTEAEASPERQINRRLFPDEPERDNLITTAERNVRARIDNEERPGVGAAARERDYARAPDAHMFRPPYGTYGTED